MKNQMHRSVRFWIHCPGNCDGGFIRLTLRPGQSLTWCRYRTTDEGWSLEMTTWTHDEREGLVIQNHATDGVDCDGRLYRASTWVCPIADLAAEQPNDYCLDNYNCLGIMLPAWVEENAWQRDYEAEKVGY